MSDDKAKVLDRVVKLIRLAADNPNEEEARSAALKACRLMAEHRIGLRIGGGQQVPAPPRPGAMPPFDGLGLIDFIRLRDDARQNFDKAVASWVNEYFNQMRRQRP